MEVSDKALRKWVLLEPPPDPVKDPVGSVHPQMRAAEMFGLWAGIGHRTLCQLARMSKITLRKASRNLLLVMMM